MRYVPPVANPLTEGCAVLRRMATVDSRFTLSRPGRIVFTDPEKQNPDLGVVLEFGDEGFRIGVNTKVITQAVSFQKVENIHWSVNEFASPDSTLVLEEYLIQQVENLFSASAEYVPQPK